MYKEIEIKPITDSDYDFGYNVKKTVFKEYVEETWGKWDEEEQISSYKNNFKIENNYIIEINQIKIGWLNYIEQESIIKINQIFILPEYQSKGYGTIIIKKIIDKSRKNNKSINLCVLKCNKKALKFYERLNFIKNGESDTHFFLKLS